MKVVPLDQEVNWFLQGTRHADARTGNVWNTLGICNTI